MVGLVQGGANKVVHTGICHDKCLAAVTLDVKNAGKQTARLPYDEAPGLEQQVRIQCGENRTKRLGVELDLQVRVEALCWPVIDPKPTSDIYIPDLMAVLLEFRDQIRNAGKGGRKWLDFPYLRSDVYAHACNVERRMDCRALIESTSSADLDSELMLAKAGGDIGVCFGGDVGIDAKRKTSLYTQRCRSLGQ